MLYIYVSFVMESFECCQMQTELGERDREEGVGWGLDRGLLGD